MRGAPLRGTCFFLLLQYSNYLFPPATEIPIGSLKNNWLPLMYFSLFPMKVLCLDKNIKVLTFDVQIIVYN